MAITTFLSRTARLAIVPVAASLIPLAGAATPASAGHYAAISGSGSTWASLAIDQWMQAVRPRGIVVNYNPDGSAAGRADYIAGQDDFAASDVPFRNGKDKLGGTGAEHSPWGYSYLPLTATGVTFVYNLRVNGHLITNLRLSGKTLMEIFTGKITNWDDPQITRDYGHRLPSLRIVPVGQADAGTTYYFTRWMAQVYPSQWNAFCDRINPSITPPCGQTEFYPQFGNAVVENGSANVLAYVTSSRGNGAIGYVEYEYAVNSHFPVLKLGNPAGKYVRPVPAHVTTALTRALIVTNPHSPEFLQEDLNPVYASKNPANYVLSYYGYLITPRAGTKLPPNFTNAKGRTLSTFIDYALCGGQHHIAPLGYAPLPPNLVAGGLQQVKDIPGHVKVPSLAKCRATAPSYLREPAPATGR